MSLSALALIAGCGEREIADDTATPVNIDLAVQQDCLLNVWSEQDTPDVDYDRANDAVEGGTISCATGGSASQFRDAIEAIRVAAQSGDRKSILQAIGVPLVYIDSNGNRRELRDGEEIDALFEEIFDPDTIELLSNLDVRKMTVEKDAGGFFELGSIWLAVPEPGAPPRIVTVNRQALSEAVQAARRRAKDTDNAPAG